MDKNRKVLPIFLMFAIFIIFSGLYQTTVDSSNVETVKVNPFIKVCDFEGWGTSLCVFANVMGGWPEASRNNLEDLMFDKDKGLGLNIVRYNIGGGDNPLHNHMDFGKNIPGFEPSEGVYDWTADANQRTVLKESISRGVNVVEAFSNSPPYWMTNSQCSGGAVDAGNNLKEDCYEKFADYLTEVVKHYRDDWGITFNSLEPVNEPSGTWWFVNKVQEGCHFDPDKQSKLIKLVSEKLKQKGLDSTIISASDEGGFAVAEKTFDSWDNVTKSVVSRINSHQYGSLTYWLPLTDIARAYKKDLWVSEFGTDGGEGDSIIPGLTLAANINGSIKVSGATAWIYWQSIENIVSNWGCIRTDFKGNGEIYKLRKQYYVMANYSKFIRPGYTIIGAIDDCTLAAYSKKDKKLVLVRYNDQTTSNKIKYDLTSFEKLGSKVEVYRTSATENLKKLSNLTVKDKALQAVANANSVTTFVISCVTDTSTLVGSKTKEILKDTIVLKAKSNYILLNGMNMILDYSLGKYPELKSGKLYVPIDFLNKKFGGELMNGYYYSDKKIKLNIKGTKTVVYTVGSKVMVVNGKKVNMTLAPKIVEDFEMYVELDSFVKAVAGRKLLYSGDMAIIYEAGKAIDGKKDKAAIDKIKQLFKYI